MRLHLTFLAFVLVLAACGGGDTGDGSASTTAPDSSTAPQESTTTSVPATTTAAPEASSNGDFCVQILREQDEDIDVTDPEVMEDVLTAEWEHLNDLPAAVPAEIADEWTEFLAITERSLELYDEYDYDLFSIPTDEIEEIQAELQPFQSAILDYCGIDDFTLDEPENGDESPDTTTPEAVPEEAYSPPGVIESQTEGILTLIRSEASFDELVAFYEQVLGRSADPQGEGSVGFREPGVPPAYLIGIEQREGYVLVSISVPNS